MPDLDRHNVSRSFPSQLCIAARWAALLASVLLGLSFTFRNFANHDVGDNLAYGEETIFHGRIVDSSRFVYMVENDWAKGPGNWVDEQGRYRFPNANWLAQAIMAALFASMGWAGLTLLQGLLIFLLLALSGTLAARLGAGPVGTALVLVLIGVTAQTRFPLRAEMFGYVVLLVQLHLLLGALQEKRTSGSLSWKRMIVLAALQILLVNLHSYFLFPIAFTGAIAFFATGKWAWDRRIRPRRLGRIRHGRRARRAWILVAAQSVAVFVNPWTWRLALLPFQTVLYMRRHKIVGAEGDPSGHPWSVILELFRPFHPMFEGRWDTLGLMICLGLGGIGLVLLLVRRRWAQAFIVLTAIGAALSLRRNIGLSAVLILPFSLGALGRSFQVLSPRLGKIPHYAKAVFAAGLAALACWLCFQVVTSRYWYRHRASDRFAFGPSRLVMPMDASAWLSKHRPAGRLWTDHSSSSNFHYFTDPRYDVPVLTNTWASPPKGMEIVLDVSMGELAYQEIFDRYDVQIVAVPADTTSGHPMRPGLKPLLQQLQEDPNWTLVYVDAYFVLFLRSQGPNAELARRERIDPATFDANRHAERVARMDPFAAHALYIGGVTLDRLGMVLPAEVLYRRCLARDPDYTAAWNMLGQNLGFQVLMVQQAERQGLVGLNMPLQEAIAAQGGMRAQLKEARACIRKVLQLDPDRAGVRHNLRQIDRQLEQLEAGL